VGGKLHAPAALTLPQGKRPGTQCTEGCLGSKVGRDGAENLALPPGYDPRTVQPVAGRYSEWAIATELPRPMQNNIY